MSSFLVFNFDGTGNEPEDAIQEIKYKAKREDDNISNVLKLHLMMGGTLFTDEVERGSSSVPCIDNCFYYQGVGTYGNWIQRKINQGLGLEHCDVATIITRAMKDFDDHYQAGDIVLVTGFSRGAALARRFVSLVERESKKVPPEAQPFVFLCVFDTVASIGLPNFSTASRPDYDVVFEGGFTLSPLIKQALHMVSLDEKRRVFQPTLMNYEPNRISEVWFSGAHSDVGGGYYRDGLSDITLSHAMKWLEHMSRNYGLPKIPFFMPDQDAINDACPDYLQNVIGVDDLQRNPNPLGKNHQQDRWPVFDWLTLDDRVCCVINGDKINHTLRPIIHHAVVERLHRDDDYRPKSLLNVKHSVWHDFINSPVDSDNCDTHIHYAAVNWKQLCVDQAIECSVEADRFYNFTGVIAAPSETYNIEVFQGDQWHDGKEISCDGNGWNCDSQSLGLIALPIRAMKQFRRVPDVDWFTLCAAIGNDDSLAKPIGQRGDYTVEVAGELTLFANDLKSKYGNNSGSLRVKITRTA